MKQAATFITIATLTTLMSAGCGSPTNTDPSDFGALADDYINRASGGGASAQQISILREAQEAGSVSFEQAKEATLGVMDCLTSAGLGATYAEYDKFGEVPIPGWDAQYSADQEAVADTVIDECDRAEGYWVNELYQLQPSTRAVADSQAESRRDEIESCIAEAGTEPPRGLPVSELAELAIATEVDGQDCLDHAGVTSW